jgi:EAL domain-containing protein (putative c-di-GMP-specific phosphodiesterase class I)
MLGSPSNVNENILTSILTGARLAVTYAQSIVSLKDGATRAQEMLTRFPGPDGGMRAVGSLLQDVTVSPDLRVRLDLLCVGSVFEALARDPITDHLVFVNINPLSLDHPEFWNRIQTWVWNLPIPPHRIVMELAGPDPGQDLEQLGAHSRRLRGLGLRLALAGLGSGQASLVQMARLAPDFLKVGRALVRDADRNPYQASMLNALARFAERMGVGYVAEGIETLAELQAAHDAGVPLGQGFVFGEPQPLGRPGI